MPLNNQWINKEIKGEIKNCLRHKWKHNTPKFVECIKNSSKREVHINRMLLPQEKRKIGNKQFNLNP